MARYYQKHISRLRIAAHRPQQVRPCGLTQTARACTLYQSVCSCAAYSTLALDFFRRVVPLLCAARLLSPKVCCHVHGPAMCTAVTLSWVCDSCGHSPDRRSRHLRQHTSGPGDKRTSRNGPTRVTVSSRTAVPKFIVAQQRGQLVAFLFLGTHSDANGFHMHTLTHSDLVIEAHQRRCAVIL